MARRSSFRPVKRPGAFTRKAKAHGMSVQAYARKVMHDPNASTRTKRQANFARVARKWHHRGRKASRR